MPVDIQPFLIQIYQNTYRVTASAAPMLNYNGGAPVNMTESSVAMEIALSSSTLFSKKMWWLHLPRIATPPPKFWLRLVSPGQQRHHIWWNLHMLPSRFRKRQSWWPACSL